MNRRKQKGEVTWDMLAVMTFFVITTLVIAYIMYDVAWGARETFNDRENCRLSVVAHDALHYQASGVDVVNLVSIDCHRRLVTVTNDHIEVNGKKEKFYDGTEERLRSSYDEPTPDVLNAIVADELTGCWYQFLQGRTDFLGKKTYDWGNDNKRCFICSEISFTKGAVDAFHGKAQEPFIEYAARTPIWKRYADPGVESAPTVKEYLFNDKTLCTKFYESWGTKEQGAALGATCPERYLSFWSREEAGFFGGVWDFMKGLKPRNPSYGEPFLQRNVTITPKSQRDQYVVLFIAEGGSAWHEYLNNMGDEVQKHPNIASLLIDHFVGGGATAVTFNKEMVAGYKGEVPDPTDNGVSTYFAWVLPANELDATACNAYFA